MRKEPVLILLGGLAGVIDLGLIAVVALGWVQLDGSQITAIVAFVAALCLLAAGMIRGQVYSPHTVDELTRATAIDVELVQAPPAGPETT